MPPNRRDMGMVFQAYSLFPNMTAERNVEFGLRIRGSPASGRAASRSCSSSSGSGHAGKRYPHQLSGGMQQRVALARALAIEPRVLLLDEPLSALDAKVRVQLREEIRRIQSRLGITTIYVTHDQEEALSISDRVAVLSHGRIEQIGPPEEIYSAPATPFVAEFVGTMNRLEANVPIPSAARSSTAARCSRSTRCAAGRGASACSCSCARSSSSSSRRQRRRHRRVAGEIVSQTFLGPGHAAEGGGRRQRPDRRRLARAGAPRRHAGAGALPGRQRPRAHSRRDLPAAAPDGH